MEYAEQLIRDIIDFDADRSRNWEKDRKPYAAIFELTSRCNMNCIHCYLQKQHSHKELSTQQVIEILDILYEKSILFITFTGGEILTRNDFLIIYTYAKKKGFLVELFTNAYLLSDEIIEVLKEYPPILVDVSLYGGCEETYHKITGITGAYKRVLDNCRKVKDSNIRIAFKSPILKETFAELPMMEKISDELGILFRPSFEIIPTVEGDLETKTHQLDIKDILTYEFYEHERHNKSEATFTDAEDREYHSFPYVYDCKIGVSSFVIDFNGNMCPCMKLRHHGTRLTKENFDEIWNSYSKYKKMELPQESICRECGVREYCEVCPAEREFINGDILWRCSDDCAYANARANYYINHIPAEDVIKNFN